MIEIERCLLIQNIYEYIKIPDPRVYTIYSLIFAISWFCLSIMESFFSISLKFDEIISILAIILIIAFINNIDQCNKIASRQTLKHHTY